MMQLWGGMDRYSRLVCLFFVPAYILIISMSLAPAVSDFINALLGPVWLYLIFPIVYIALVAARSYKVGGFSKFEFMAFGFLFLMVAIVNNS